MQINNIINATIRNLLFRTFSRNENSPELPPAIFLVLEVLIGLVFLIGSVLNSVLMAVFFRRRGFRTSISNRYTKKNRRGNIVDS